LPTQGISNPLHALVNIASDLQLSRPEKWLNGVIGEPHENRGDANGAGGDNFRRALIEVHEGEGGGEVSTRIVPFRLPLDCAVRDVAQGTVFALEDGAKDISKFANDSPIGVIDADELSDVPMRHAAAVMTGP
jgi:hypothetical protein